MWKKIITEHFQYFTKENNSKFKFFFFRIFMNKIDFSTLIVTLSWKKSAEIIHLRFKLLVIFKITIKIEICDINCTSQRQNWSLKLSHHLQNEQLQESFDILEILKCVQEASLCHGAHFQDTCLSLSRPQIPAHLKLGLILNVLLSSQQCQHLHQPEIQSLIFYSNNTNIINLSQAKYNCFKS